jgi:hypothetical protein
LKRREREHKHRLHHVFPSYSSTFITFHKVQKNECGCLARLDTVNIIAIISQSTEEIAAI